MHKHNRPGSVTDWTHREVDDAIIHDNRGTWLPNKMNSGPFNTGFSTMGLFFSPAAARSAALADPELGAILPER
jgi:hypothetical protein